MSYRSTDGDTRNWSDSDGGELSESDDESSADYEDGYEYQNQNDYVAVGDGEEEDNPETIEMVAAEPESKLTTVVKANISIIKEAIRTSRNKWEQDIEEADRSYAAETESLSGLRKRIKAQELILSKRTRVRISLPRAVAPAHNLLRKEDNKERILISEFFDAVKIEKTDVEARRAERIKKADDAHVQEYEALFKQLQGLQIIAQLSGIELAMEADGEGQRLA